jgi:hypothetical protein
VDSPELHFVHPISKEGIMATSNNPLAPNAETDIDSAEIHDIPLRDLETGEVEELDPEEEELDENIERGDV